MRPRLSISAVCPGGVACPDVSVLLPAMQFFIAFAWRVFYQAREITFSRAVASCCLQGKPAFSYGKIAVRR